jgi:hypothetical protein
MTSNKINKIRQYIIALFTITLSSFSLAINALAKVDGNGQLEVVENKYGISLFEAVGGSMLGLAQSVLTLIAVPICICIIIAKLVIIVLGFLGGGQGQEMANHIKHIFICLILLGVVIYLAQGKNILDAFVGITKSK